MTKSFSTQGLMRKLVLNSLYYSGANWLCKRWTGGLGSILMLHHVRADDPRSFSPNAHLSVTPEFLDETLASLTSKKLDFVSMDEAVLRIGQKTKPASQKPFIAVTLDDGYRDNLKHAVPIFRKYKMPYTIYVASGFVDGKADIWWEDLENIIAVRDTIYLDLDMGREEIDTSTSELKNQAFSELMEYLINAVDEKRQREIVRDLATQYGVDVAAHRKHQIMNWSEIAELNNDPLCTIGAHTIHHPRLARLNDEDVMFEMAEGARIIEAELGERPKHFAYPYGMPNAAGPRDFYAASECGFASAVTTRHGVVYSAHRNHVNALPRISLNGGFQSPKYVKSLISGIPTLLENRGKRLNIG